jgi:diguanylate cyclase (GGDEF)-like protein
MTTHRRRIPAGAVAAVSAALILSAVVLLSGLGGKDFQRAFTDLAQLTAATTAFGSCALAAARSRGRGRGTWIATAVGCGGWAAGQAVWTWYELGRHIDTPFPSAADIGFLVFPVAACTALILHPARGSDHAQGRRVLDALVATTSLALVSWETALGAVISGAEGNRLAVFVSLAYPLSDFLLLVLVVLILTGAHGSRLQLGLLAAGMAAFSVSDSGFAYLTAVSSYGGGAIDLGWIGGFLLIALATRVRFEHRAPSDERTRSGDRLVLLPYLPVAVAGLVTVARLLTRNPPSAWQSGLIAVVVVLLLVRQYVTLHENTALTGALAVRETQLRHQAFHDTLTGLANRALFQDRLGHALDLHSRDLRAVSLLFLDLDDFKLVNDTLGHGAGDELLVRVAERLLVAVRTGDTVARLGGDEFAVLLEDGGDPVTVAAAVETALRPAFVLTSATVQVAASIGVVAVEPSDGPTTADDLLAKADTAMYTAKRAGKGQLRVFTPGMSLTEMSDQRMGAALAVAIAAGELTLDYQPIVSLPEGTVEAFEALARWRHQGRDVPPAEFVAVAERTGVVIPLTCWVMESACQQVVAWSGEVDRRLQVAVNVSPAQLSELAFVDTVADVVRRHHVQPGQLILEISESGELTDLAGAHDVLAQLRTLGVCIALNDFGLGSSSLAQLLDRELDIVKVDRSFLDRLEDNPRQAQLLRNVVRLGADLGLNVVAVGAERPGQLEALQKLGCRLVQGQLVSPPLRAEQVPSVLHRRLVPALRGG